MKARDNIRFGTFGRSSLFSPFRDCVIKNWRFAYNTRLSITVVGILFVIRQRITFRRFVTFVLVFREDTNQCRDAVANRLATRLVHFASPFLSFYRPNRVLSHRQIDANMVALSSVRGSHAHMLFTGEERRGVNQITKEKERERVQW